MSRCGDTFKKSTICIVTINQMNDKYVQRAKAPIFLDSEKVCSYLSTHFYDENLGCTKGYILILEK